VNDEYALIPPGGELGHPWATTVVDQVVGDRARLAVKPSTPRPSTPLPVGALAYPIEVSLGRRPIAVLPLDHPARPQFLDAFRDSSTVRVVGDDHDEGLLATLELSADGVMLRDAQHEPFWSKPLPTADGTMTLLYDSLLKLARATHVR